MGSNPFGSVGVWQSDVGLLDLDEVSMASHLSSAKRIIARIHSYPSLNPLSDTVIFYDRTSILFVGSLLCR